MRRLTWIAAGVLIAPTLAGARQLPPPPVPPAPTAPVAPPAPPAAPPVPTLEGPADMRRLQSRMRELQNLFQSRDRLQLDERAVRDLEREMERVSDAVSRVDERQLRRFAEHARRIASEAAPPAEDIRRITDEARLIAQEASRLDTDQVRQLGEQARLAAEETRRMVEDSLGGPLFMPPGQQPPQPPQPPMPTPRVGPMPRVILRDGGDGAGLYNNGLAAVQQRQYDRAIAQFDRVLAQTPRDARADGALYWKAFAQARLVRLDDALATLTTLRRDYPQSRYLADAKVLESDLRKMGGQRIDPETLDANDEIKLLAINGIANTDPDRAIPLLEGVLNATNTLGNKRRALYVLALNDDPRAHQILLRYAKGAGTPELQMEAIRYLAQRQDSSSRNAELREIYESTQDVSVRRAIIDAFRTTGDKGFLVAVVKDKTVNVDLKRSALSGLATMTPPAELWALYQQETDPELRSQMVGVFAAHGASEQLLTIARTEKDPNVRLRAIRSLGSQATEKTGAVLVELYGSEQDANVRRSVIAALASQNNAEALVAIARKENSLELKREIVRRLSDLAPRNKVAADYLMDVIK